MGFDLTLSASSLTWLLEGLVALVAILVVLNVVILATVVRRSRALHVALAAAMARPEALDQQGSDYAAKIDVLSAAIAEYSDHRAERDVARHVRDEPAPLAPEPVALSSEPLVPEPVSLELPSLEPVSPELPSPGLASPEPVSPEPLVEPAPVLVEDPIVSEPESPLLDDIEVEQPARAAETTTRTNRLPPPVVSRREVPAHDLVPVREFSAETTIDLDAAYGDGGPVLPRSTPQPEQQAHASSVAAVPSAPPRMPPPVVPRVAHPLGPDRAGRQA